ncbi:hypothetical protein QC334_16750 [Streptomyces sp. DH18]|nr:MULTISPECIES: hypothetical protein [unclassified Streptomyces]MDG9684357.1 hypothetical protein [Streptomyces sp. DH18]
MAAEVDVDGEMQAGVAEKDEGFFLPWPPEPPWQAATSPHDA